MDEDIKRKYSNLINSRTNKNNKTKRYIKNLFIRIFIVLIIFISLGIACKMSPDFKDKIYNYLGKGNISFTKINKLYNKYLGEVIPSLKKKDNTAYVFNENLRYDNISKYYDGAILEVDGSYLVPALKEGMVIFIGEKENYGNTVIIEDLDGVDTWYGNIDNTTLGLYDYVDKGTLVGEVKNKFYLVFTKSDKFLDYEEYIK